MPSQNRSDTSAAKKGLSAPVLSFLTMVIASLVANLYYAQPLISSIGPDIGVSPELAGSIVSAAQVGYGLGLFFIVPLADLVETRLLVMITLFGSIAGLFGIATAHSSGIFFLSSFVVGWSSTAGQVLMLTIAHLTPIERRGRAIGSVMAGLLGGIMLARPLSLFVSGKFGWRGMFYGSGLFLACCLLLLVFIMPRRKPHGGMNYGTYTFFNASFAFRPACCTASRGFIRGCCFVCSTCFWTTVPVLLETKFGMGSYSIGLFALAGAGSTLAAPWAGRQADRGYTAVTSLCSMFIVVGVLALSGVAASFASLVGLLVCTILLDAGVQTNQILSQRIVFSVPSAIGGRANGIYMTIMFVGGALGSVLGTMLYHWGGWSAVAGGGTALSFLVLILFIFEPRATKEIIDS